MNFPVRIDHIDEHPTRRQEFAVIVEKCQQEMNGAVGMLCEFMQEPDDDPAGDEPDSGQYIT